MQISFFFEFRIIFKKYQLFRQTDRDALKNPLKYKRVSKTGVVSTSREAARFVLLMALFVFPRDNPQQNGLSLLTPGSDSVTIAFSDGMIHFTLHGSPLNQNLKQFQHPI